MVDDEAYLADLVATALRYEGFEPVVAGCGREALALADARRPDLIVLDVMLPDRSGLDVCRRLRQSGHDTPVVFLTAKDATEDKITGLRSGGDDYVTKPFSLKELIVRITAVLRRPAGHHGRQGWPWPTWRSTRSHTRCAVAVGR